MSYFPMCLSSLLLWTCDQLYFRYIIDETIGYYVVEIPKFSGWVHGVMVYHGTGSGISVYQDGIRVGTSTVKVGGSSDPKTSGDGRVLIGKRVTTGNQRYTSVLVDEVKMYNRQLSEDEICKLN